jgi:DNA polymerase-1
MDMNNKILIVDAMNTFIRNYVMDPSIGADGFPIGGTRGFLKTLQKLIRETEPQQIIVVWDGSGGSKKRRTMLKQYKEGRKPLKLNRAYDALSTLEESQNKYNQIKKTIDYLNATPIIQFMVEDVEADDVIAYICGLRDLEEKIKIIISSDKDFIQLCNSTTILYRPKPKGQKDILNESRVVEQYNIHPTNFAVARAIDGDKSDNIEGVRGVGLKTLVKNFPELSASNTLTLDEIFNKCEDNLEKNKVYSSILASKKKVELNYALMQLYAPEMSYIITKEIRTTIKSHIPYFNHTEFMKMLTKDGLINFDWEIMFQKFRSISFLFLSSENLFRKN